MTPDFLLHLSNNSVALDYRSFADHNKWHRLGEIPLEGPDVEASLLALRNLVKRPYIYPTDILIALPPNRIELLKIPKTGLTDDEIKEALTNHTTHRFSELYFDCLEAHNQTIIAWVTLKTLKEIKTLAKKFGFNPICFVGLPGDIWQNNFAVFDKENSLLNTANLFLPPSSRPIRPKLRPELPSPSTSNLMNVKLLINAHLKNIKDAFHKVSPFGRGEKIRSLIEKIFVSAAQNDRDTGLETRLVEVRGERSETEKAVNETKQWLGINTQKSWYEELSGTVKPNRSQLLFNFSVFGKRGKPQFSGFQVALITITFWVSITSLTAIYSHKTVSNWLYSTDVTNFSAKTSDQIVQEPNYRPKVNSRSSNKKQIPTDSGQELLFDQIRPAKIKQLPAPTVSDDVTALTSTHGLKKSIKPGYFSVKHGVSPSLSLDLNILNYSKSEEKSFSITGVSIQPPIPISSANPIQKVNIYATLDDRSLAPSQSDHFANLDAVSSAELLEKQSSRLQKKEPFPAKEMAPQSVRPLTRLAINMSAPDKRPLLRAALELENTVYTPFSDEAFIQKQKNKAKRGPINYTQSWLNNLAAPTSRDPEWTCLTEALYFEARGEKVVGQFAVAEVILNRVDSSKFPNTICAVVDQGSGRRHACQFSYKCDGVHENIPKNENYARAGKIAEIMIKDGLRQLVGGATFYHSTSVKPFWSSKFYETTKIGKHKFYTPTKNRSLVFFRPTVRPSTIKVMQRKDITLNNPTDLLSKRPKTRPKILELAKMPIEQIIKPSEFRPPTGISGSYTNLTATSKQILNFERINLIGVNGTTKKRSALVRLLDGEIVKIGIGDSLNGGHVVDISPATLTYLKSGKSIMLTLPKS